MRPVKSLNQLSELIGLRSTFKNSDTNQEISVTKILNMKLLDIITLIEDKVLLFDDSVYY